MKTYLIEQQLVRFISEGKMERKPLRVLLKAIQTRLKYYGPRKDRRADDHRNRLIECLHAIKAHVQIHFCEANGRFRGSDQDTNFYLHYNGPHCKELLASMEARVC